MHDVLDAGWCEDCFGRVESTDLSLTESLVYSYKLYWYWLVVGYRSSAL